MRRGYRHGLCVRLPEWRKEARRISVFLWAAGFAVTSVFAETPKEKPPLRHTVRASVEYGSGEGPGIQAKKVTEDFTVPEGFVATDFKYLWMDPKSGQSSDKLRANNIYSITEKRFVTEAREGPNFKLPAGKYRFSVGGYPGATGVLTYVLRPTQTDEKLAKTSAGTQLGTIEVETWPPDRPHMKTRATYNIKGNQVTGVIDQVDNAFEDNPHFQAAPQHTKGSFEGTLDGRVITGTWKVEVLPYRVTITGGDGSRMYRTDRHSSTMEIRLTLHSDGTASETLRGSGITYSEWGEGPLSGKSERHPYTFPPEGTESLVYKGKWKKVT